MDRFKKILAPVDLSTLSKTGVIYALEIAMSTAGGEVLVYNVITPGETPYPQAAAKWFAGHMDLPQLRKTREKRERVLAEFIRANFAESIANVRIRQEVAIGVPHRKILEKASAEKVDIIVICTHGRTGLRRMLIGSVSQQIVRRAPCPVLTVPPPKEAKTVSGSES
ncbi:MAG: universal stress protein [Candidatus Binatia bacterium]